MNQNPNDLSYEDEANASLETGRREDLFSRARRYQDVQEEINPQGEFVPIINLLDRELVIISLRFQPTKKGLAAFPACVNVEGEVFHTFTASKVIVPKLQGLVDHLPIRVTFTQREGGSFGKFYDLE